MLQDEHLLPNSHFIIEDLNAGMNQRLMIHHPQYFADQVFHIKRFTDMVIGFAFFGNQFDVVCR